jgi:predicted ATPase
VAHRETTVRIVWILRELVPALVVCVSFNKRSNVIISAAAAPAELYEGEKLKFEFQRTASRLIEMQSEEYLARAHRAA